MIINQKVVGGGGSATINGRNFDCGSFTPASNITQFYLVNHNLGVIPSAAFVWIENVDYSKDNSFRGITGKYRSNQNSYSFSSSVTRVNTSISSSVPNAAGRFALHWDIEKINLGCDSMYPLLAGEKYQWLVIGGGTLE